MYRAKVESVSGINVRAGGKWLTCIGNKPVRVGDYVWTDGRCVYGNNRVSQQPLVITAPDDEVIPIIIRSNPGPRDYKYYTFDGKKLSEVFPEEPLPNNKQYFQINNKKGNVFVVNDLYEDEELWLRDTMTIIATNVDNKGNKYCIRFKYAWKIEHSSEGDEEVRDFNKEVYEIIKNDTVIETISLVGLKEKLYASFPASSKIDDEDLYLIRSGGTNISIIGAIGFIENEESWYLQISLFLSRTFIHYIEPHWPQHMFGFVEVEDANYLIFRASSVNTFYGSVELLSSITEDAHNKDIKINVVYNIDPITLPHAWDNMVTITYENYTCTISGAERYAYLAGGLLGLHDELIWDEDNDQEYEIYYNSVDVCINNQGAYVLCEHLTGEYGDCEYWEDGRLYTDYFLNEYKVHNNEIKFPLGDGYYYTLIPYFDGNGFFVKASYICLCTFFSPNGKKIVSVVTSFLHKVPLICNFKGNLVFLFPKTFFTENGYLRNECGLYIFRSGEFGKINDFGDELKSLICNERLRPMKRFKNWEKRIRELTF